MESAETLLEILRRKVVKGMLNKAIDLLCHQHFPDPFYIAPDILLHYEVEKDNPEEFSRKFAKYNLKYVLQEPKRKLSERDLDKIALKIIANELSKVRESKYGIKRCRTPIITPRNGKCPFPIRFQKSLRKRWEKW